MRSFLRCNDFSLTCRGMQAWKARQPDTSKEEEEVRRLQEEKEARERQRLQEEEETRRQKEIEREAALKANAHDLFLLISKIAAKQVREKAHGTRARVDRSYRKHALGGACVCVYVCVARARASFYSLPSFLCARAGARTRTHLHCRTRLYACASPGSSAQHVPSTRVQGLPD